jgi:hypothetical protein
MDHRRSAEPGHTKNRREGLYDLEQRPMVNGYLGLFWTVQQPFRHCEQIHRLLLGLVDCDALSEHR